VAKILVIEDAFDIRENLKDILNTNGHEVFTAGNEQEGITVAFDEKPDLIVCDINMGRRDSGFHILKTIRSDVGGFGETVPFVFLTAAIDRDSVRRAMSGGADDYVTKPFTSAEILDVIATRLRRSSVIAMAALPSPMAYIVLHSQKLPEEGVRYDVGNYLMLGRNEQCYPRILNDPYTSSFACVIQPKQDEEGKLNQLHSISDGSIGKMRKLAPGEDDPTLSTYGVWINDRRMTQKFAILRGGETVKISPHTWFEFHVVKEAKKKDDPTQF
jgi:DNA-binding response OmpR family regulator